MEIIGDFLFDKKKRDECFKELSESISERIEEDQIAADNFWRLLDWVFEKVDWPFLMENLTEVGKGQYSKNWLKDVKKVIEKEFEKESEKIDFDIISSPTNRKTLEERRKEFEKAKGGEDGVGKN